MKIGIIYAKSLNNVIGNKGKLPWHLPEDLKHFKETTKDCVVAMGSKTWVSLPIKPLPNRTNLILTSSNIKINTVIITNSIEQAINEAFYRRKDIWFIGGSNVINKALLYADTVIITELHNNYEGDTRVEDLTSDWKEITRATNISTTGIIFDVIKYEKRDNNVCNSPA